MVAHESTAWKCNRNLPEAWAALMALIFASPFTLRIASFDPKPPTQEICLPKEKLNSAMNQLIELKLQWELTHGVFVDSGKA